MVTELYKGKTNTQKIHKTTDMSGHLHVCKQTDRQRQQEREGGEGGGRERERERGGGELGKK